VQGPEQVTASRRFLSPHRHLPDAAGCGHRRLVLRWGVFGIRVHGVLYMKYVMVSTGSCRANAHNSGISQQIGAFRVTRLTMILSAYPTPPGGNQVSRSIRGGPHTGQMPLCEAETSFSP